MFVCLLARLSRTRVTNSISGIVLFVDVQAVRQLEIDGFVCIFDLTSELLTSCRS